MKTEFNPDDLSPKGEEIPLEDTDKVGSETKAEEGVEQPQPEHHRRHPSHYEDLTPHHHNFGRTNPKSIGLNHEPGTI